MQQLSLPFVKIVIGQSAEDGGFAHAAVAQRQNLEEVVVVDGRGRRRGRSQRVVEGHTTYIRIYI
jgi:hypothetical protein